MRYWYHSEEKNSVVTIAEEQLRALIRSGALASGVLVWKKGMDEWRPAHEVPSLRIAPPGQKGEGRQGGTAGEHRANPVDQNAPDPIPESCEACNYFKRVSTVNPAKGHCAFYEIRRYADNACYAHEALRSDGERASEAGEAFGAVDAEGALAEGQARGDASLDVDRWMYLDGEEQRGPLRRGTIQEMLAAGALSSDTLLWADGCSDWTPAYQLEAFKRAASGRDNVGGTALPETHAARVPTNGAFSRTAEDDVPQMRPWVRYFARTIDGLLAGFGIGIIASLVYPPLLQLSDAVLGLLVLFLFVFIEPFFLANWGTTPGKSLFRTSVLNEEGGFLSYPVALRRSFDVWLKGLGAGIPLISLVALGLSYAHFKDDGVTSWDERAGSVVVHRKIGASRVVVAVVILLVMFGLMAYG